MQDKTPAAAAGPQNKLEAAIALQKQGRFDEARDLLRPLLIAQPRNAAVLSVMATLHYQLGQDAEAVAFSQRMVATIRTSLEKANSMQRPPLVLGLANQLLALGEFAEAEDLVRNLKVYMNPVRADFGQFREKLRAARAKGLPSIFINTLPKSASESIWNRLADGLGMPQANVSVGFFPRCTLVGGRVQEFALGGLTTKEHIRASNHNLEVLKKNGVGKMIFHLRDPRQAALSWAHFVKDDISLRPMASIWRDIVPPASVLQKPFEALLDWCVDSYMPMTVQYIADWMAETAKPDRQIEVLFLDFELFRRDPTTYLREAIDFYGISADFYKEAGAGDDQNQDKHFRKGETDEWRGVFSAAQQKRAWAGIPSDMAQRFGWTE